MEKSKRLKVFSTYLALSREERNRYLTRAGLLTYGSSLPFSLPSSPSRQIISSVAPQAASGLINSGSLPNHSGGTVWESHPLPSWSLRTPRRIFNFVQA